MVYQLKREELEWVENAYRKGLSRLEMRQKLIKAGFSLDKVKLFEYKYDELFEGEEKEKEVEIEENDDFKEKVFKYYKGEEIPKRDMKDVEKFSKEIKKYLKIWKDATNDIEKGFKEFEDKIIRGDDDTIRRVEDLRGEIIDRLLESKVLLEIKDPNTGEDITKGSLKQCSTKQLIQLMKENTEEMDSFINGKIRDIDKEVN